MGWGQHLLETWIMPRARRGIEATMSAPRSPRPMAERWLLPLCRHCTFVLYPINSFPCSPVGPTRAIQARERTAGYAIYGDGIASRCHRPTKLPLVLRQRRAPVYAIGVICQPKISDFRK